MTLALRPAPRHSCLRGLFAWSVVLALATAAGCGTVGIPKRAPSRATGDTLRREEVAPGVVHRFRWIGAGPWALHVTDVDLATCGLAVRTVKALDRLAGRETTTQLAAHLGARSHRPVIVTVNGDFFSLKGAQGVPLAAQVVDGTPLKAASGRPVFAITTDGRPWFGLDRVEGSVLLSSGEVVPLTRINEPPVGTGLALENGYLGDATPADSGVVELVAEQGTHPGGIGDTARAIVRAVDVAAAGVALAPGVIVLAARGEAGDRLRAAAHVGDTLRWVLHFAEAPAPLAEVIGGSARLVREGRSLAPFPGASDRLRHPRTAVGVDRRGHLLLVTVDGRQKGYSDGMTLAELATLFVELGARDAMNLDGGGSTAMVVNGRVVNRPSDATGERPVGNALGVVGPAAGRCR